MHLSIGTGYALPEELRVLPGTALAIKIYQEERFMMETFPGAYPAYRAGVKALFPGIR